MFGHLLVLYFLPLLLALAFFTVGVWMAFRPPILAPIFARIENEPRTGSRFVGVLIMAFTGYIALFILAGPTPWERVRLISSVLEATPAEVVSAEVAPGPLPPKAAPHLVTTPRTIDRQSLERICDTLHRAEACSGKTNNDVVWECELQLRKRRGTTDRCFVCRTISNGVLIRFESKASFGMGWNVGTYRADSLGPILESVAWNGP
ncbi:MAG: hypothetical protein WBC44_07625 [Planctomycetaceae bacterium]